MFANFNVNRRMKWNLNMTGNKLKIFQQNFESW